MATIAPQIASTNGARPQSPRGVAMLPDRAIWHASAPESVRTATDWGIASDGWQAWAEHLGKRRAPDPLSNLLPGKATLLWGSPLGCSAAADLDSDAPLNDGRVSTTVELVVLLDRLLRKKRFDHGTLAAELSTWLNAPRSGCTVDRSLECLAWARVVPKLAAHVPAGAWWRLLTELLRAIDDAHDAVETNPLVRQLLGVELPLLLAHQLPEIQWCRDLAPAATAACERGIVGLVDEAGFVKQRNLALVRPLLACWTRVMVVSEDLVDVAASETTCSRFRAFVRQSLRWTRRDGSMALSADRSSPADRTLFLAAVEISGSAPEAVADKQVAEKKAVAADRHIAQSIFSDRQLSKKQLQFGGSLPPSSAQSETAGLAMLRPSWSRSSEQLWVAYSGSEVRIELASGRDRLLSGTWEAEVRLGARPLTPRGNWEQTCWNSDEDVDYLELEIALSEHVRLERQILLARKDRLLLLADVILRDETGATNGKADGANGTPDAHHGKPESLEYHGTLPLGDDVAFDAAGETREGYLVGRKPRAVVFPLALPEWRSEMCGGSLETTATSLDLRQARTSARRMYVPLLFDLDTKRILQPATWRTLTVAENRVIQPADVAVGYRVQAGKEQWMFYRSLAARGNRTLLGQNLASEFLAARFNRSGETEPLLEIE